MFFSSCPAHSLVKNPCALIHDSFNFHPFELKLELWECARVRVAKSQQIQNRPFLKFRLIGAHSHDPSTQRQPPLEFELEWTKTEGGMCKNTRFFARKITKRAHLACFASNSHAMLERVMMLSKILSRNFSAPYAKESVSSKPFSRTQMLRDFEI